MSFFNKKSITRIKQRVRLIRDGFNGKSGRTIEELRQNAARQVLEIKAKNAATLVTIREFKRKISKLERRINELSDARNPENPSFPAHALIQRALNTEAIRLTPEGDEEARVFRELGDDIFRFFGNSRSIVDITLLLSYFVPTRHGDFTRNALDQVEILLRLQDSTPARSYAHSLMNTPGMEKTGQACMVKVALSEFRFSFAYSLYQILGDTFTLKYLPQEWILILADSAPQTFLKRAAEILADEPRDMGFDFYFSLAQQLYTHGDVVLALSTLERLEAGAIPPSLQLPFAHFKVSLSNLEHSTTTAGKIQGNFDSETIRIGVLDYKNPDFSKISRNIGDYTQTLAFLGNVIEAGTRNHNRWGANAEKILGVAAPEISHTTPAATGPVVEFERLDRDFMSASKHIPKTWVVVYGWYMHPQFELTCDFPFPSNLRPVFLSFHINRQAMLTPAAIEYLKDHCPIGCRDWSTVYLLRNHGIEAFFSGCMTMTLNKIYQNQPREKVASSKVALVDVRAKQVARIISGENEDNFEIINQELEIVRRTQFLENLHQAKKLLDRYREEFSVVHTSRLHCYLPCRAIGVPVEFTKPGKENDIRFEGLIGIDEDTFAATRDALQNKLAGLLDAIMTGGTDAEIYQTWRELCREDVEKAEEYCSTGVAEIERFIGIPEFVTTILAGKKTIVSRGETSVSWVEVCLAVDQNQLSILPNTLRSIVAHASNPIRFHLLTRGLTAEDLAFATACVSGHEMIFYPMDGVFYGKNLTTLPHITVSTMDRLLLPHILEQVDKVLYLDTDILVRADITELFQLDLGDHPLAGRTSLSGTWKNGYQLIARATKILPPEAAFAFRRLMHTAHGSLSFPCFNAGILVLNLDRLRRDDFCARFLPWADRFRLNDQDILNCYCGNSRKELPIKWNSMTIQEVLEDPSLVHWAGSLKPWSSTYTIFNEEWRAYSLLPNENTSQTEKETAAPIICS